MPIQQVKETGNEDDLLIDIEQMDRDALARQHGHRPGQVTMAQPDLDTNLEGDGKLTERWTDFALKGGNLHSRVELDAPMPGKNASHQVYFSSNM